VQEACLDVDGILEGAVEENWPQALVMDDSDVLRNNTTEEAPVPCWSSRSPTHQSRASDVVRSEDCQATKTWSKMNFIVFQ
jgi:hypothetical protein